MNRALIIYAHPNPKSFNHALLETVEEELKRRGFEVRVHDLYRQKFDPVLSAADFMALQAGRISDDLEREQQDVSWAEVLVFIHPIWWFERPAILKGWFDRVFSFGYAYRATAHGLEGLLGGRRALVLSTSGAFEDADRQSGMTQAADVTIIKGTLSTVGLAPVRYRNFYGVPMVSDDERRAMLGAARDEIAALLA